MVVGHAAQGTWTRPKEGRMRKLCLGWVFATMFNAIGDTGPPSGQVSQGSDVGGAAFFPLVTASFDARSGPQGENPRGFVTVESRGLVIQRGAPLPGA